MWVFASLNLCVFPSMHKFHFAGLILLSKTSDHFWMSKEVVLMFRTVPAPFNISWYFVGSFSYNSSFLNDGLFANRNLSMSLARERLDCTTDSH